MTQPAPSPAGRSAQPAFPLTGGRTLPTPPANQATIALGEFFRPLGPESWDVTTPPNEPVRAAALDFPGSRVAVPVNAAVRFEVRTHEAPEIDRGLLARAAAKVPVPRG